MASAELRIALFAAIAALEHSEEALEMGEEAEREKQQSTQESTKDWKTQAQRRRSVVDPW